MEEDVWKELTLSSLHHHYSSATTSIPSVPRPPLQEFLACPFTKTTDQSESAAANRHQTETPSSSSNPFTNFFAPGSKRKGGPETGTGPACDVNRGEWKKIRLMKNRESAARSRARKQAYTYELKLEVAHLEEENAKLRQEVETLRATALGEVNQKKKPKLRRTITAPF